MVITEKKIKNINYKIYKDEKRTKTLAQNTTGIPIMIEIWVNDRYGRKERIKCFPQDTILIVKKLISAKIGTRYEKIKLQIASRILNDNITLDDYEIHNGMGLEMYYY